MKFFRNPEVIKTLLLCVMAAALSVTAAALWDSRFGWFTLAVCALFIAVYTGSTYRRYKRLALLAADIDRILHGDEQISLETYAEGELAILHSEICKMTVRLREQKQRLQEDKGYLADSLADISHQIRTPLTSVNLLVSLLCDPHIAAVQRQAVSRELYEQLSRIDWLITTLLKLSRLDAGTVRFQAETVPVAELIRKAVSPLLVAMELRGQVLTVTAEGDFCGDMDWTSEALTNILKNCMEHTPDGGAIAVHAEENALYTEITVTDNGKGIAKEDLPHIFERFYKGAHSGEKSFGIGLSLSRMIITGQNGTIKAENITPHGAKFTLRFYKGII